MIHQGRHLLLHGDWERARLCLPRSMVDVRNWSNQMRRCEKHHRKWRNADCWLDSLRTYVVHFDILGLRGFVFPTDTTLPQTITAPFQSCSLHELKTKSGTESTEYAETLNLTSDFYSSYELVYTHDSEKNERVAATAALFLKTERSWEIGEVTGRFDDLQSWVASVEVRFNPKSPEKISQSFRFPRSHARTSHPDSQSSRHLEP